MLRPMIISLLLAAIALPVAARADVTVYAAASLKGSLDKVAENWTRTSGVGVVISYGSSPAMAKQILQGAPAQIYFAASEDWMDELEKAGVLVPETRIDILSNRLVVVGPAGQMGVGLTDLPAALQGRKFAMALVDAVPAGVYGKAALKKLGLWDVIEPSVVQAENVRAALALVASGEAAFGLVYVTDAMAEPKVSEVAMIPRDATQPILYPGALVAPATPEAVAFMDYLISPMAMGAFVDAGFSPISR